MWKDALEEELNSIIKPGTLIRSTLPGRRTIGTKFVFKQKVGGGVNVIRYKARLVALGNLQITGFRLF